MRWKYSQRLVTLIVLASSAGCSSALKVFDLREGPLGRTWDHRPELASIARNLGPSAPAPVWQAPLNTMEVFDVTWVGDDRLLVSSDDLLTLYDRQGSQLWEHQVGERFSTVVATDPLVVLSSPHRTPRFFAFDIITGDSLWARTGTENLGYISDSQSGILVIAEDGGEAGHTLSAISLRSGEVLWVDDTGEASSPILEKSQGHLLVISDRLSSRSFHDGSETWEFSDFSPEDLILTPDGLAVLSPEDEVAALDSNGRVIWRKSLPPGELSASVFDSEMLLIALTSDNGGSTILGFDLSDGREIWRHEAPGSVVGELKVDDSVLFFSSRESQASSLHAVSLATGESLWRTDLPMGHGPSPEASFVAEFSKDADFYSLTLPCPELPNVDVNLLPDRISTYPSHTVVIQETGVSAFDRSTGSQLWTFEVHGTENSVACGRFNLAAAMSFASEDSESAAADGLAAASATMQANNFVWQQQQQSQYEQSLRRETDPARRSMLISSRTSQLRAQHAAERTQASLAFAASVMAFTQTMAHSMAMAGPYQDRLQRIRRGLDKALPTHFASTQGDLYLRAFTRGVQTNEEKNSWENCWHWQIGDRPCGGGLGRTGVLLVDLRTGAWTEVTTSPWHSGPDQQTMNLQYPSFSPDGSLLTVAGMGLDPQDWTSFDRLLGYGRYPRMTVLAFDSEQSAMAPASEYDERFVQIRGEEFGLDEKGESVQAGSTTLIELVDWFGEPHAEDGSRVSWESIHERGGIVAFQSLSCEIDDGIAKECQITNRFGR